MNASRDHEQTADVALEAFPVEALLDALADAERDMEGVMSQHNPKAPARHYCQGKASGLRAAWEIVLRHRAIRPPQ